MELKLLVNQKTRLSLRIRLPLLALLVLLPAIQSCTTSDERQGFAPTIYAGNSESGAVERDQAKESVSCKDKKFDEMFCMYDRDLENLFKRCLEQAESDRAWYHFGKKKAGNVEVNKPDESDKALEESTPND